MNQTKQISRRQALKLFGGMAVGSTFLGKVGQLLGADIPSTKLISIPGTVDYDSVRQRLRGLQVNPDDLTGMQQLAYQAQKEAFVACVDLLSTDLGCELTNKATWKQHMDKCGLAPSDALRVIRMGMGTGGPPPRRGPKYTPGLYATSIIQEPQEFQRNLPEMKPNEALFATLVAQQIPRWGTWDAPPIYDDGVAGRDSWRSQVPGLGVPQSGTKEDDEKFFAELKDIDWMGNRKIEVPGDADPVADARNVGLFSCSGNYTNVADEDEYLKPRGG